MSRTRDLLLDSLGDPDPLAPEPGSTGHPHWLLATGSRWTAALGDDRSPTADLHRLPLTTVNLDLLLERHRLADLPGHVLVVSLADRLVMSLADLAVLRLTHVAADGVADLADLLHRHVPTDGVGLLAVLRLMHRVSMDTLHDLVLRLADIAADGVLLGPVLRLARRDLHRVVLVTVLGLVDRPSALERNPLADRVEDRLVDGEFLRLPDRLLHRPVLGLATDPRRTELVAGPAGLGRTRPVTGRSAISRFDTLTGDHAHHAADPQHHHTGEPHARPADGD